MELRVACVADERHQEAELAPALRQVEQGLLAVHVHADLGNARVEPIAQRRGAAIALVQVHPGVVSREAHLVKAALARKGHEGGLHAGVACLGGYLALAHLEVAPHHDDLLGLVPSLHCHSRSLGGFRAACVCHGRFYVTWAVRAHRA